MLTQSYLHHKPGSNARLIGLLSLYRIAQLYLAQPAEKKKNESSRILRTIGTKPLRHGLRLPSLPAAYQNRHQYAIL